MKITKILKTESMYLRSLSEEDVSEKYLQWMNDPEVNLFLESRFNPPKSVENLRTFIGSCCEDKNILLMGIFTVEHDFHIGNIKLGPINRYHKFAELGFLIGDKKYWGKNYATKAISLISKYGMSELGLEKIIAGCYANNIGSIKALEKAGFIKEGHLKSHWFINEKRQDGYIYGKINSK